MKNENFIDISSLDARFLVKLAESQNSKEASSYMNWSISKVAHRLSIIEERLGKKLFQRNRRAGKYIPTKDVINVLPFLNNIIQSSELLHSEINIRDSHIRITSSQTILEFYLGPHIREFIDNNPDLRLALNQKDDLIVPIPKFNEILITSESECKLSTFKYFPYHSFKQKLWASPSYIDKYGLPRSVEDLYKYRLLMRKNTDDPRILFGSKYIKTYLMSTQDPNIFDINGVRLVDYLCENGCGIMAGSEESIKLGRYNLENVMPDFDGDMMDLYVGVNKELLKSSKTKRIINWLFEIRNRSFRTIGVTPSFDFTPLIVNDK